MSRPLIELKHIKVNFRQKDKIVHAVNDVSLTIDSSDIYGIVGYSGAGKSTLVRVINRLHDPTSGTVIINGHNVLNYGHTKIRQLRKKIGMIFQHYNLMNARTILQNVEYPLLDNHKLNRRDKKQRAKDLLKLVGLGAKQNFYPAQLSGGQKQRVAIARALANRPNILISDEATSALDPRNTQAILKLLKQLNAKFHLTIILITHEMGAVKAICNKVAVMDNGKLIERGPLFTIFNQPKQPLTRSFIESTLHLKSAVRRIKHQIKPDSKAKLVELKYLGSATQQPLIIDIYRKFRVISSILFGNIDNIRGTAVGRLIITLSGPEKDLKRTEEYLNGLDQVQLKLIN